MKKANVARSSSKCSIKSLSEEQMNSRLEAIFGSSNNLDMAQSLTTLEFNKSINLAKANPVKAATKARARK